MHADAMLSSFANDFKFGTIPRTSKLGNPISCHGQSDYSSYPVTRPVAMSIGALVIGAAASTRASGAGELSAPLCVTACHGHCAVGRC